MGLFSKMKTAGGYVFNFRVSKWLGLDQIKSSTRGIMSFGLDVFTPEQPNNAETFEEALVRLNITEEQLLQRKKEFLALMILFLLIATAIFIYSIFIAYSYKNFIGFIMGFAVTIYALTLAFRYHFWIYQIKHRKLGCSLRDWFLDKP